MGASKISTAESCEHLVTGLPCHYCDPELEDDNGLWQTVKHTLDVLLHQRLDNAHDIANHTGIPDIEVGEVVGYLITTLAHDRDGIALVHLAMEYSPLEDGQDWGWEESIKDMVTLPPETAWMAVEYLRCLRDVVHAPASRLVLLQRAKALNPYEPTSLADVRTTVEDAIQTWRQNDNHNPEGLVLTMVEFAFETTGGRSVELAEILDKLREQIDEKI